MNSLLNAMRRALGTLLLGGWASAWAAPTVFFNEINYDPPGADVGEAIELAGRAGVDLTGWHIALYDGNTGSVYATLALAGVLADTTNGFGFTSVSVAPNGIQNGTRDGLALIDSLGAVVQFLSYEGAFTALSGPAAGLVSIDVGVSQVNAAGSVQLIGTGATYDQFTWAMGPVSSLGAVNSGQSFAGNVTSVPEPATLALAGLGLLALGRRQRQR